MSLRATPGGFLPVRGPRTRLLIIFRRQRLEVRRAYQFLMLCLRMPAKLLQEKTKPILQRFFSILRGALAVAIPVLRLTFQEIPGYCTF